jgi:hypothetical protein
MVGHPEFLSPDRLTIKSSSPFTGVLAVGEGSARRAWIVSDATPVSNKPAASLSLGLAPLYGFLGGLILNLMPCVLPVISLKILGFIRQAGDSRRSILFYGLAFVGGIFVWFLALAAVIIALKSGGGEVTWAFQFQNPWFNVVIGSIRICVRPESRSVLNSSCLAARQTPSNPLVRQVDLPDRFSKAFSQLSSPLLALHLFWAARWALPSANRPPSSWPCLPPWLQEWHCPICSSARFQAG